MKFVVFSITVFFALLNTGIVSTVECPQKIEPCVCKNILAYGLWIKCENFKDTQILVRVLANIRNYDVTNLILHNLMLKDVLPEGTFKGLSITQIEVTMSNLNFPRPAFKGLNESLQRLNIHEHSVINSSEKFAIAKLSNLTELRMKKNALVVVKNNWLNGKIPSVVNIELEEDNIETVEDRAFADLHKLHTISMAWNNVEKVKRSMFPMPAENLKEIDLSYNKIEVLPEDFFTNMPVLEKVVLAGNNLRTLDEKTWKPVWGQLKKVFISDNSLECDSSLNWIKSVGWPEQFRAECIGPDPLEGKDLKEVYDNILT